MRRRKKEMPTVDPGVEQEQEERLADAEKRVKNLTQTAEWLRTAVARRDADNHWQASVNKLFLGGPP